MLKKIKGFSHYNISDNGKLYSLVKSMPVKLYAQHGRATARIKNDKGERVTVNVLNLVLENFFDPSTYAGYDTAYIDNNCLNVSVENIYFKEPTDLYAGKFKVAVYNVETKTTDYYANLFALHKAKVIMGGYSSIKRNYIHNTAIADSLDNLLCTITQDGKEVAIIAPKRLREISDEIYTEETDDILQEQSETGL